MAPCFCHITAVVTVFLVLMDGRTRVTFAHVRLTFPPARQYALDFLDNIRTPAPCGIERNLPGTTSVVTNLQAGRKYNFTWHMAYPHKGGYRIELLKDDSILATLSRVTATNAFVQGDATATTAEVEIPKFVPDCSNNCSVRILRQAQEWTVTGDEYEFVMWSCADVTITAVTQTSFQPSCSGQGQWQGNGSNTNTVQQITDPNQIVLPTGTCSCRTGFYGGQCQYSNECEGDQECGSNGVCDFINGTSFPRKMCFCKHTYFGPKCAKSNNEKIKIAELNFNSYSSVPGLPPDVNIYWRVFRFDNEIEFAVRIKTQSWVGIGWRPTYLKSDCRQFPTNATDPDPLNGPTGEEVATPGYGAYMQDEWNSGSSLFHDKEKMREEGSAFARIRRDADDGDHFVDDKLRNQYNHHVHPHKGGDLGKMARQEHDAEWATGEWVPSRQVLEEADEEATSLISKCRSEWLYPKNCNKTNGTCEFAVAWNYNGTTDELNFDLTTRSTDRWTGIGFRRDIRAPLFSDGVVIYAGTSGQFVGDVHWNGTAIVADQRQDVGEIAVSNFNLNNKAFSRILFSRKRLTGDDPGQDLPLPETTEDCVYLAFPIMGGLFYSSSSNSDRSFVIDKPEFYPHSTTQRVCFGPCSGFSNAFYQIELDINANSFNGNGAPGSVDFALKMKEVADNIITGLNRIRVDGNDTTLPLKTIRAVKLTKPVNATNGMIIRAVALLDTAGRDPSVAASFLENRLVLARDRGYFNNYQLGNDSFRFAKVNVVSGGFYGWPKRDIGQKQINDLIFLFTIGALGFTLLMQALCNVRRITRKGGTCVPAL